MPETSNLTDEELAKLSVSDTVYFGELISRYDKILLRYVIRRSHATKEDAEDVVQNSFIKMYRNINDFDTTLRFSSWAYRITHNELIDWYRKQKSRPQLILSDKDEDVFASIAGDMNIEKEAMANETKKEIEDIIKTIDPKYQEVIYLRFFEDKSYEEIADILQIPPGTVAIRLSRAKKILQESLQAYS
ncbi:MAG: RNA polymerase sigma factor [Candidatus Paceibacterota bacterium]